MSSTTALTKLSLICAPQVHLLHLQDSILKHTQVVEVRNGLLPLSFLFVYADQVLDEMPE
jgi:hypothetical protein